MRHRRKFLLGLAALSLLSPAALAPAGATTEAGSAGGGGKGPALRAPSFDRPAAEVRSAEITSSTDATGDVAVCKGDITNYGAGYEPASGGGSIVLVAVGTACGNDPLGDPAWTDGYSYAAWVIDTNGDDQGDYLAWLENDGTNFVGILFDRNLSPVCQGSPSIGDSGRFLSIAFPGSCLGSPASFRIATHFGYDTTPQADDPSCPGCTEDTAPESGFGAVTRLGDQGPTPPPPSSGKRQGYWMIGRTGETFAFGDAQSFGSTPSGDVVDLEPTPSANGYWTVNARGNVYTFGNAVYHGALGSGALAAGEVVTALSATPTGQGYWLFTNRGKVFTFGDAQFFGDMGGIRLNGPVLDSIPTPTGRGYYMVASDGGIFAFGDAAFYGSMGAAKLNAPVQSLVPDGDGIGYWLVASDGGIFAFDAAFYGSMGSVPLAKPITGMVGFGGAGYLMVAEDGGIFAFGEAPFFGSLGDNPPAQPIVSVAILNQA